jgi:hypothetical protein
MQLALTKNGGAFLMGLYGVTALLNFKFGDLQFEDDETKKEVVAVITYKKWYKSLMESDTYKNLDNYQTPDLIAYGVMLQVLGLDTTGLFQIVANILRRRLINPVIPPQMPPQQPQQAPEEEVIDMRRQPPVPTDPPTPKPVTRVFFTGEESGLRILAPIEQPQEEIIRSRIRIPGIPRTRVRAPIFNTPGLRFFGPEETIPSRVQVQEQIEEEELATQTNQIEAPAVFTENINTEPPVFTAEDLRPKNVRKEGLSKEQAEQGLKIINAAKEASNRFIESNVQISKEQQKRYITTISRSQSEAPILIRAQRDNNFTGYVQNYMNSNNIAKPQDAISQIIGKLFDKCMDIIKRGQRGNTINIGRLSVRILALLIMYDKLRKNKKQRQLVNLCILRILSLLDTQQMMEVDLFLKIKVNDTIDQVMNRSQFSRAGGNILQKLMERAIFDWRNDLGYHYDPIQFYGRERLEILAGLLGVDNFSSILLLYRKFIDTL